MRKVSSRGRISEVSTRIIICNIIDCKSMLKAFPSKGLNIKRFDF